MGHWSMVIHGHGKHANGHPDDADALLHKFVAELASLGHGVHHASFTTGATEMIPVADPEPEASASQSAPAEAVAAAPEPEPAEAVPAAPPADLT